MHKNNQEFGSEIEKNDALHEAQWNNVILQCLTGHIFSLL